MMRTWTTQHWIRLLAATPVAWWLGVTWGMPWIIRAAHAGQLPMLGRFMAGRTDKPVEGYLAAWEPLARASVVLVLTTALIAIAVLVVVRHGRHRIGGAAGADAPAATNAQLLLIAATCGLLTGLAEAYYYTVRLFYLGQETPGVFGLSQHAVWMSPLANLLVFLLVGAVAIGLRQLADRRPSPRTLVAGFVWLGIFGVTMATDRLHWAAAAILTLGVAVRFATVLSPGAGEVAALARHRLVWVALLVVGLGATVPALEVLRERRQLSAAGEPASDAPNVLFIVLDTERAISTSLHGAARETTPFLRSLAEEGVQFDWAIAPAGWTLPSHAAMFTGRLTRELGVNWTIPLGPTHPTLAEVLGRRGYATAGFVANHKFLADVFGLGRGFGRWQDQAILPGTVIVHSWLARTLVGPARHWMGQYQVLGRKTADRVNAEFLGWLDGREPRPFFAFLNYFDPHLPYLPPEPWNLRFSPSQPLYWVDDRRGDSTYTAAERAELEIAYLSSIAYLDSRLELLFAELERRGLDKNTLVVITSDHGEEFGERETLTHGFDVTMPLIHVPLVVRLPGTVPTGRRVTLPVELRHLAATVLDLTGGDDGSLAGTSLAPLWKASATEDDSTAMALSVDAGVASLVTTSYHYLRDNKGRERLFDVRTDPHELQDLSGEPSLAGVMEWLREELRLRMAPVP